jgi:hypothetical protein
MFSSNGIGQHGQPVQIMHVGGSTSYPPLQPMGGDYNGMDGGQPNSSRNRVTFVPTKRLLLLPNMREMRFEAARRSQQQFQQMQMNQMSMPFHSQQGPIIRGGGLYGRGGSFNSMSRSAALDLAQPYETAREDLANTYRAKETTAAESHSYVLDKLTAGTDNKELMGDHLVEEIKKANRKYTKSMQQLSRVAARNKRNQSFNDSTVSFFDFNNGDGDKSDDDYSD